MLGSHFTSSSFAGSGMGNENKYMDVKERFLKHINKTKDCWEWTHSRDRKGYGRIWVDGKLCRAHRISFFLHHGTLPKGKLVLHKCDNPPCVRPTHLFLGTSEDNIKDRVAKHRSAVGSRQHKSKLTEKDVRRMRKLDEQGMTYKAIGLKYHVDSTNVALIVKRKTWKHIY